MRLELQKLKVPSLTYGDGFYQNQLAIENQAKNQQSPQAKIQTLALMDAENYDQTNH